MKSAIWMSEEKFDYSQVTNSGPPPLEAGIYKCRVTKVDARESKGKNGEAPKPFLSLTLEVLEDGEGNKLKTSRRVFDNLFATKEALWKVKQVSEALGIEPLGQLCDADRYIEDLIRESKHGVFIEVVVEDFTNRAGQPDKRNAVKKWMTEEKAAEATSTGSAATPSESNGTSTGARRPRGKPSTEVAAS